MREKTKKEIKKIVEEVLREEKLVGSQGGFWGAWIFDTDKYVEGVVSKLKWMETLITKLRDRTNLDDYEYVEEKKLKKKKKTSTKTATEAMLCEDD